MNLRAHLATFPDRCPNGFAIREQHPQLCSCQPTDEWLIFVAALSESARGGRVHQSDVRARIRGRIAPKHIGSLYRRARVEGLLIEVAHERSDDLAGKNAGRLEPVYELGSVA